MSLYENLMERLSGREYSNYFACLCPFHSDHSPSLFVYEDGYRCASCGAKGSLKRLEQKVGSHFHPSRDTVSNILPNWKRWEFEYGDIQGIAEHAHKTLTRFPQFQGYFKRRKIDGYIEKGFLGYNQGWITVPCYDATGKMVDLVVRGIKKGETRYVVKPNKNAPRPLYVPDWKLVNQSESVIVVYGIFDAISLAVLGYPVITGMSGKAINPELLMPLRKRFTIIPDLGEEKDAHILANQLGWRAKVHEIDHPGQTKDINGIHEHYGVEVVHEALNFH